MVKTGRHNRWTLVGGMAIGMETAPKAAAYNARAKLGLNIKPGPALVFDHVPENESTGAKEGLNIVFDGGILTNAQVRSITLSTAPSATEPEITAYRFMTSTDLLYLVSDYQRVRIRAAAQQRGLGGIPYLYAGKAITRSAA
ncbi:hypothetical protein ACH4UT_24160 [Streptomyces sp. NPDC020799]|uniref:hypothetical protein n=1 Tax=Streptomyces sp. NPDC020799 TaxID=3365091 RepID=UPI00379E5E9E